MFQINGIDISSYAHEDAVRVFLTADEPIIVEIKRRVADSTQDTKPQFPKFVSTSVQTDISTLTWFEENTSDYCNNEVDLEVK